MFCLPPSEVKEFLDRIKSGDLNPDKLAEMSSIERRAYFEEFMSKPSAEQTNAQFESKLLLKNQQQGIINWAKKVSGLSPEAQRDIIARVNKMDEVLNPKTADMFLKDLAAHKLGTTVTMEEAARLSDLAKQSAEAKTARDANPNNENILKYGQSKQAFGDYLDSVKPSPNRGIKNTLIDIANIPKSALTSILHFSAMGVQGWGMASTPEFWKAAAEQFKYFASENNYKNAEAMISGHPDYDIAKSAGLSLTKIDGKLNDREEAIQSSLLQKGSAWLSEKTKTPDIVRASSRAFTGFMNYLRFSRFEDLLNAARLKGEDVSKGSDATKDIAQIVNSFTGRGSKIFGMDVTRNQSMLNTLFFSPRKMAGSFDMFNPMTYLDPEMSPTARAAAIRQLTGSLLVTGALLGVGKLIGGQIETNPIGTNFGKIKIGNTTIDLTGGNASYVRLLSQIIANKEKSSTGKVTQLGSPIYTTSKTTGKQQKTPFTAPTRLDQFIEYGRDHLAPVVSTLVDWAAGSNVVGQPFSWKQEAYQSLTPLVSQAFYDMYKNDRATFDKVWPLIPSVFGYSTSSAAPAAPKKK
ncbi:MAG TPA: hypothetical protein VKB38_13270 [Terracidiphilus sp.]|nr:hypothetical protein [Terracidiphilus sp.]